MTAPPRPPHRSPDEPLRAWRWLTGLLVDEVCLARARAGMLVTLRRCIPRGLVIVDAQGALLHLAQRCRRRMAKWSRFPSRRLSEVLKAINPGIVDGV